MTEPVWWCPHCDTRWVKVTEPRQHSQWVDEFNCPGTPIDLIAEREEWKRERGDLEIGTGFMAIHWTEVYRLRAWVDEPCEVEGCEKTKGTRHYHAWETSE